VHTGDPEGEPVPDENDTLALDSRGRAVDALSMAMPALEVFFRVAGGGRLNNSISVSDSGPDPALATTNISMGSSSKDTCGRGFPPLLPFVLMFPLVLRLTPFFSAGTEDAAGRTRIDIASVEGVFRGTFSSPDNHGANIAAADVRPDVPVPFPEVEAEDFVDVEVAAFGEVEVEIGNVEVSTTFAVGGTFVVPAIAVAVAPAAATVVVAAAAAADGFACCFCSTCGSAPSGTNMSRSKMFPAEAPSAPSSTNHLYKCVMHSVQKNAHNRKH
jgi:hypothetical protein